MYLAYFQRFNLGAVNEARTRDPQLGKLMLYQLSYYRVLDAKVNKKWEMSKRRRNFFLCERIIYYALAEGRRNGGLSLQLIFLQTFCHCGYRLSREEEWLFLGHGGRRLYDFWTTHPLRNLGWMPEFHI